jgi:hypothetical protein
MLPYQAVAIGHPSGRQCRRTGYRHRGVAQPGSVLAWGASGRPFKSARPDQIFENGTEEAAEPLSPGTVKKEAAVCSFFYA